MTDNFKTAALAVIAAALAVIAAALTSLGVVKGCVQQEPGPRPSPSPSPLASVAPSPSTTAAPSPVASAIPSPSPIVSLKLMKGETDGVELTATEPGAATQNLGGVLVSATEVSDLTTLIPSYKGARVGAYPMKLSPVTGVSVGKKYWVDFTGQQPGKYMVKTFGVSVGVEVIDRQFAWPLPLYMEAQLAQIGAAHGLADTGTNYAARVALAKQYHALLRSHGIEPIKQAVTTYPDTTFSNLDWKSLVLDGRIAGPCLFGPAPTIPPSVSLLQAIEAALKSGALPKDSWAYAWDEGEGDVAATASALARVNLIRANAPSLRIMVTRRPDPAFGNVIFTPVVNLFNGWGTSAPGWLYHSCMSNGNCANTTLANVAPATKFPMAVFDGPENDPQRFVNEAYANGATGLLYYNTTEAMPSAATPGGLYKWGGNGDGTLVFPNGAYSKLLKFYRRGLNDVAWKKAGMTR